MTAGRREHGEVARGPVSAKLGLRDRAQALVVAYETGWWGRPASDAPSNTR